MKKLFNSKIATLAAIIGGGVANAQTMGGGDPCVPFSLDPAWTTSYGSTSTQTKVSGQPLVFDLGVSCSDTDTFLYSMSIAPYFYYQQDPNAHLWVNNCFVVGDGVAGITFSPNIVNWGATGTGVLTVSVPASYTGGGFLASYDLIDNVDAPIKDSTVSAVTTVTINY